VLSLDELLACGLTEDEVWGREARGQLHRIHRGVYAVGHPGLTQRGRWLAAVKACGPGALLCRHAAGMHYGFLSMEDRRPQVMTTTRRTVAGVRNHRTRDLPERDRWRHGGIPITTVERTLLDLAATMPDKELRRAMSRAQSLRLTSPRQLAAILTAPALARGAGATHGCSPAARHRRAPSWRTACMI
jgi:predicted transcriptional regulator of viral defense system